MANLTAPLYTVIQQGGSIPPIMGGAINPSKTYYPGSLIFFDPATQYFEPDFADNSFVTVGVLDSDAGIIRGTDVVGTQGFQTWIQKVHQGWALYQPGTAGDAIPATTPPGTPLYAIDNQTVGLTDGGGTRPLAGKLIYVNTASVPGYGGETGVWVEIRITQGPLSTISGTTAVANGGTGRSSLTAHDLLIGNGASNVTLLAPGTSGLPVVSQGAGSDPHYAALDASGIAANAVTGPKIATTGVFRNTTTQGHNNTGAVTFTGAKVGDVVILASNVTDHTSAASAFESTISVNDQIQQTSSSDLSAKTLIFMLLAQS